MQRGHGSARVAVRAGLAAAVLPLAALTVCAGAAAAPAGRVPIGTTRVAGLEVDDLVLLAIVLALLVTALVMLVRARRLRASVGEASLRADTADDSMRRLEAVARSLLEAETPQDVLDVVLAEGLPASGARAGLISLLADDGVTLEAAGYHGFEPELIERWTAVGIDEPYPLCEAARIQEPIFLATLEERDRRFPALAARADPRTRSSVSLPLVYEGRTVGAIHLSFDRDADFDAEHRMLNLALAAQAAQALQRARMREAERTLREKLAFLAEASDVLSSSFDYEANLRRVAELAVPRMADWCLIDLVTPDGGIRNLTVAHADPERGRLARELLARHPFDPDAASGPWRVIETGEPELTRSGAVEHFARLMLGDRDELLEVARGLGLRASIVVPLTARGRTHGALTLVAADSVRPYTDLDLDLALDLARRTAVAIDNAEVYLEAELRADAARALRWVADAVVLVGTDGAVRFLNPAAERLLGDPPADGWRSVGAALEAAHGSEPAATVPVAFPGGERWLRVSRAPFEEGAVYALHDVTEEWELERTRRDFVSTASHELRTPLAAVYGSIQTLLREDCAIAEPDRRMLLELGARECRRLTEIIDDLLLAGQLGQGQLRLDEEECDPRELAAEVVETVGARALPGHELRLDADGPAPVSCDVARLRQALLNLVDNAVKYSPDGGRVTVRVRREGSGVAIAVEDEGLGIPAEAQELVFEKFYRLDPDLTRGVGGTGLGLYITRELVERMGGTLDLRSVPGHGSTFTIRLPRGR